MRQLILLTVNRASAYTLIFPSTAVLAIGCLQAFQSAGLIESENTQIIKATKLCLSYAPRAVTNMPRRGLLINAQSLG